MALFQRDQRNQKYGGSKSEQCFLNILKSSESLRILMYDVKNFKSETMIYENGLFCRVLTKPFRSNFDVLQVSERELTSYSKEAPKNQS